MSEDLFSGSGIRVTRDILRTKRRSYELKNIEYVSVHQPLLVIMGAIAVGLLLFTISFHRYLYTGEIIATITASAVAVLLASKIGSLKVHSLALRDDQTPIFGNISTLHKVKEAIETAIELRRQT